MQFGANISRKRLITLDKHYSNPRLVALYDIENPWGADYEFYLSLLPAHPVDVLEIGCGTGHLACAIAERGHHVTAVDPAVEMLHIAKSRPQAEKIKWIHSTAQAFTSDQPFDFIFMSGHVFQIFLGDEDILELLGVLKRVLKPAGTIAFETRNPAARAWEQWTPALSRKNVVGPDGPVTIWHDVIGVTPDMVAFETHYHFASDNSQLISESLLRFIDLPALQTLVHQTGLKIQAQYGNWDKSPFMSSSPKIILLLQSAIK